MHSLTDYFSENNETIEYIFRNSGKDYNDLGRYEDCHNNTDFHYILATIPLAFPIPMSVGLCVPKLCTVTDFDDFKSHLIPMLNKLIPEVFEGIKGFDHLSLRLTDSDLQFVKSMERNAEETSAGVLAWIIGVLLFVLLIAVIVSSFKRWQYQKKTKKNSKRSKKKKGKSKNRNSREEGVFAKDLVDDDEEVESLDGS